LPIKKAARILFHGPLDENSTELHDDDEFGDKQAKCPKCKDGSIIAEYTGWCSAYGKILDTGHEDVIDDTISHEWSICHLSCSKDECDWEVGANADGAIDECEEFLIKMRERTTPFNLNTKNENHQGRLERLVRI
jgi:hypothetical protein